MIKLILIISIYQCSVISIYRAKIATNIDIQEDTLCFLRVFIGLSAILLTSIYHSQTFSTYFARISLKLRIFAVALCKISSCNIIKRRIMARKRYPIGIQTFDKIRTEDRLYIDKTEYVYRMTHSDSNYIFLGRPRRFGKSLLVSTLQSYFEGKKELFKGLAIEKLEQDWTEYPVLHFSMAMGKHMEKEQLERYLLYIIGLNEKKFGIELSLIHI